MVFPPALSVGVKPTKIFKQKPGDMLCVACAAAHATNTTPEEFQEFCKTYAPAPKQEAPYEDIHFGAYLASHGFLMGFGVKFTQTLPNLPHDEIQLDLGRFPITRTPAYVIVESPARPDWTHAIYWDGEQFWDSSPLTQHGRHPSEYKILSWCPIFKAT